MAEQIGHSSLHSRTQASRAKRKDFMRLTKSRFPNTSARAGQW